MTALEDIRTDMKRTYVGRKIADNKGTLTITDILYSPMGLLVSAKDQRGTNVSMNLSNLEHYKFV